MIREYIRTLKESADSAEESSTRTANRPLLNIDIRLRMIPRK